MEKQGDYGKRVAKATELSAAEEEKKIAKGKQAKISALANSYRDILNNIGENPEREGLLKTPERASKALLYFTKGYDEKISGLLI